MIRIRFHYYGPSHGHAGYRAGMPMPEPLSPEDERKVAPDPLRSAFIDQVLARLRAVEHGTFLPFQQKEAA